MNSIKPLHKILCSFFCVLIFKIICILVGVIEVIGGDLDCNDEVKKINPFGAEGYDCKARDGDLG
jgi:hypothetical protein